MHLHFANLFGWAAMLLFAWGISYNRRNFPWRTVLWGLGLQLTLAVLVLDTPWGAKLFEFAGKVVQKLIQFSTDGTKFVFGPLADADLLGKNFGPGHGLVFAILVTGTVVIVAALSSLFYHWGILQRVVRAVAFVMRKAMGTSGSETLSAAANIFMGQTEAPLVIRPYVPRMTRSELMTIMVCGMAHIAGGVAAVYAAMGMAAGYPNTAGHLLTASVLNCPAALLIAKIMLPETQVSETAGTSPATVPRTTANSVDAICRGAGDGFQSCAEHLRHADCVHRHHRAGELCFWLGAASRRHDARVHAAEYFRLGQRAIRVAHGRAGERLREPSGKSSVNASC